MSHDLTILADGFTEMAWLGNMPWHGLGQQMQPGDSLAEWQRKAGMDWTLERAPVEFTVQGQRHGLAPQRTDWTGRLPKGRRLGRDVLYRSDTHEGLSLVSSRYREVQPAHVLAFFDRFLRDSGFQMSAAGTMRRSAVLWATARTGQLGAVVGSDEVEQHVLVSTSCDGSSATEVRLTNVRVVCANTLAMAHKEKASVRMNHNRTFDIEAAQRELVTQHLGQIQLPFDAFMQAARTLAQRTVNVDKAHDYLLAIARRVRQGFMQPQWDAQRAWAEVPEGAERRQLEQTAAFGKLLALFEGEGRGASLPGTRGTAWGLLNAVTEYVDHHPKGGKKNQDPADRYFSAWMGRGSALKQEALALAQLV